MCKFSAVVVRGWHAPGVPRKVLHAVHVTHPYLLCLVPPWLPVNVAFISYLLQKGNEELAVRTLFEGPQRAIPNDTVAVTDIADEDVDEILADEVVSCSCVVHVCVGVCAQVVPWLDV